MTSVGLGSEDFMAIARALDQNGNNKVDPKEINVSQGAHMQIGNGNGVAGTREFATSLEKGDIFINNLSPESADKVADYFSKREVNFGQPAKNWQNDAWISKDDLALNDRVRGAIDVNGDNKVSRKEFAQALTDGTVKIRGGDFVVSENSKPNPFDNNKPINNNPFDNQKPINNNPFDNNKPVHNNNPFDNNRPVHNNNPFDHGYDPRIDSGANMEITAINKFSFESDRVEPLAKIARRENLSINEQKMIIDSAAKMFQDDNKGQVLGNLARNSNLHPEARMYMIDTISSKVSFEDSKANLFKDLLSNQKLSGSEQKYLVDKTFDKFFQEDNKVDVIINMAKNQYIDNNMKGYILNKASDKLFFQDNKTAVYNALY